MNSTSIRDNKRHPISKGNLTFFFSFSTVSGRVSNLQPSARGESPTSFSLVPFNKQTTTISTTMHDPDCDGRARVGADKGFHLAKLNSIEQTPQRTSCPKGAKITSFKVEAVILFLRHGKGHLVSHTMTEEWRVKR